MYTCCETRPQLEQESIPVGCILPALHHVGGGLCSQLEQESIPAGCIPPTLHCDGGSLLTVRTRKHSSRVRIARSSPCRGGLCSQLEQESIPAGCILPALHRVEGLCSQLENMSSGRKSILMSKLDGFSCLRLFVPNASIKCP